jgi:hypothetical protein
MSGAQLLPPTTMFVGAALGLTIASTEAEKVVA